MAFRPSFIPQNMSFEEYSSLATAAMALASPAEVHVPVISASFLSVNEQKFLQLLSPSLPGRHICCQVQLIRLIKLDKSKLTEQFLKDYQYLLANRSEPEWFFFNLIRLLSLDFVFLNAQGVPTCAVELDGPEHETDLDLIERDKLKAQVLGSAGIPFQRFKNADINNPTKIGALVAWVLSFP